MIDCIIHEGLRNQHDWLHHLLKKIQACIFSQTPHRPMQPWNRDTKIIMSSLFSPLSADFTISRATPSKPQGHKIVTTQVQFSGPSPEANPMDSNLGMYGRKCQWSSHSHNLAWNKIENDKSTTVRENGIFIRKAQNNKKRPNYGPIWLQMGQIMYLTIQQH